MSVSDPTATTLCFSVGGRRNTALRLRTDLMNPMRYSPRAASSGNAGRVSASGYGAGHDEPVASVQLLNDGFGDKRNEWVQQPQDVVEHPGEHPACDRRPPFIPQRNLGELDVPVAEVAHTNSYSRCDASPKS